MQKQQAIIYARQSRQYNRLKGHIVCGYCGCPLVLTGSASGLEYRCTTRVPQECRGASILVEPVETAVWSNVDQLLSSKDAITTLIDSHPVSAKMEKGLEWLEMVRVVEPTSEEKRQALEILGVKVVLYQEDDPDHDRFEITYQATSHSQS